jgi:colanic acid/amylovoran biosynthesis protein
MKILVDNGCYDLVNLGDVSMLQVTINRLRDLWPNASINVVSRSNRLLKKFCPQTLIIYPKYRYEWYKTGKLMGRCYRLAPDCFKKNMLKFEKKMWENFRSISIWMYQQKISRKNIDSNINYIEKYLDAFYGADLVVASGGGYITDDFKWHIDKLLNTLETAAHLGIPTAMFGQGLGPINDSELLSRVKAVLPLVDLIAIRETRSSKPLLDSLGVNPENIIVTGDDAIETAYSKHSVKIATGIGVNMRAASYSKVNVSLLEIVGKTLHEAGKKYAAPLIPLPISMDPVESDVALIRKLLSLNGDFPVGIRNPDEVVAVIEQVKRCRIVISGSYHSAVFALALGIPAICIANSQYYMNKFAGLADQFGVGCDVISADQPSLSEAIRDSIDKAWKSAKKLKPLLLKSAKRQVEFSRLAYQRIYNLLEAK